LPECSAIDDEREEHRPEVSYVGEAKSFAGVTEWLARAATGSNRLAGWPSGKGKSQRPTSDSGEEMTLGKSRKVAW
jgi:hypothetical protein